MSKIAGCAHIQDTQEERFGVTSAGRRKMVSAVSTSILFSLVHLVSVHFLYTQSQLFPRDPDALMRGKSVLIAARNTDNLQQTLHRQILFLLS